MRKLATIRKVDKITPIDGADKIELAHVGGWKVVVQKGEYSESDRAVYCEIDSWIPTEIAPFLSKGKEPSEYNGVKGERLRTIKLRGQISQGLLLKTSIETDDCLALDLLDIGEDVTECLNIQKWEPEIPVQMQGKVKGSFPNYIPKTDQERVQNLSDKDLQEITSVGFEVSEKLEGSSITIFQPLDSDELGVCSRNIWLDVSDTDNVFVKTAIAEGFERIDSRRYAFQGELVGEGIQGNIYKLKGQRIYIYNVYDISTGEYLPPVLAKRYVEFLGFKYVPVKYYYQDQPISLTIGDFLEEAEGISALAGVQQEGIVVKSLCGQKSFKAINNKYLLGEK